MLAKEIMSTEVFTVLASANLNLVDVCSEAMHIRHVPVVNEDQEPVGILSIRDVMKAISDIRTSHFIAVNEIMTRDVITATPETPIADVARLMHDNDISSVAIVEAKKIIGIITERDFLKPVLAG